MGRKGVWRKGRLNLTRPAAAAVKATAAATAGAEDLAVKDAKKTIVTLTEEMAAVEAGTKKLNKFVAKATVTRQAEDAEYKETMSSADLWIGELTPTASGTGCLAHRGPKPAEEGRTMTDEEHITAEAIQRRHLRQGLCSLPQQQVQMLVAGTAAGSSSPSSQRLRSCLGLSEGDDATEVASALSVREISVGATCSLLVQLEPIAVVLSFLPPAEWTLAHNHVERHIHWQHLSNRAVCGL